MYAEKMKSAFYLPHIDVNEAEMKRNIHMPVTLWQKLKVDMMST